MAATEQEHAEILAQLNREMQEFGQVLPGTRASLDSVGKGGAALRVGLDSAGKAVVDITKAYTAAAAAMYNGEKGMKAYSKSIDAGADAVTALAATAGAAAVAMGVMTAGVGFMVAAVGLAAKGLAEYAKAANEQSDALFNSYQKLSRVGAAGADSLQGIYDDMQKLGLGVQDLDKFVAVVSSGSKELAMMSGSVYKGRKAYAEVSAGMDKFKLSLLNSGMTQDEINEGTMDYLRLQSRAGLTQKKSVDELVESTNAYLKEQDALTQLTGLSRKEQSDQRERLRNDEAFGSQVAAMRLSQDKKQADAADEMEKSVMMLSVFSDKAAEGLRDLASGNLTSEASRQLDRETRGEAARAMQDLKAGIINGEQAFDRVAEAITRTVMAEGKVLGSYRVYNKVYTDAAGSFRIAAAKTEGTMLDQARENYENRKKMGADDGKALSAEQQRQAELVKTQQNSMKNMQDFVRYGVTPATEATAWFAKTVENLTSYLPGAGKAREEMQFEKNLKDAEAENKKILIEMEKQKTTTNKREIETAKLAEKAAREKRELLDKEREELLKVSKYFKAPGDPKVGPNGPIGGGGGRGGVGRAPATATKSTGSATVVGNGGNAAGGGGSSAAGSPAAGSAGSAATAAQAKGNNQPAAQPTPTPTPTPVATPAKPPPVPATISNDGKTASGSIPKTALGAGLPGYSIPSEAAATQLKKIRDMIGQVESFGGNYNVVVDEGNKNFGLTNMTLDEINQFQRQRLKEGKNTPVGKYQMKIDTLGEMAKKLGIKGNQKFDEETQDKLADFLIRDRGGYDVYARNPTQEGKERLLSSLARIWAGLPRGPDGKSAHDGVGNNKALLPWTKALESFGDGGIVTSPTFAQIGEKGSEAVIPLKNGSVPVTMPRDFIKGMSQYQLVLDQIKSKFDETAGTPTVAQTRESQALPGAEAMLTAFRQMSDELKAQGAANRSLFESMLSIQKSSNDIQSKLLRHAQN